jgi:stage V sporulation protein S
MSDTSTAPTAPNTKEEVLKVSSTSNPQKLGAAIAHASYNANPVYVQAIGASAVNQAVKAIAIARGFVAPMGRDLFCKFGFVTVQSKDGDISAIRFSVYYS